MGVTRAGFVAVLLAVAVYANETDEHDLQSLSNPNASDRKLDVLNVAAEQLAKTPLPRLHEYEDHAEVKMQMSDVQETTVQVNQEDEKRFDQEVTTTEVPEPLPSPWSVKIEEGNEEDNSRYSTKKPIVPRKQAVYPKPSVVGKKGVSMLNISMPNDDADQSTQSVYPRKGADPQEEKAVLTGVEVGTDKSSKDTYYQSPVAAQSVSKNTEKSNGKYKDNVDNKEVSEQNKSWTDISKNSSTTSVVATSNPLLGEIHAKPTVATDELDAATTDSESDYINFGAVILGLLLCIALAVTVVLGYRKFKDIWMRRHYAHVNFLVDGMYDM